MLWNIFILKPASCYNVNFIINCGKMHYKTPTSGATNHDKVALLYHHIPELLCAPCSDFLSIIIIRFAQPSRFHITTAGCYRDRSNTWINELPRQIGGEQIICNTGQPVMNEGHSVVYYVSPLFFRTITLRQNSCHFADNILNAFSCKYSCFFSNFTDVYS